MKTRDNSESNSVAHSINPFKTTRFAAKAGVIALLASSVLLIGQVQAGNPEPAGQSMGQSEHYKHKGEHHRGHKGGMFKMLRKLELSDSQKAEVKLVMEKYKSQRPERPTDEQREAHRAQVLALITQDGFDESAAQNLMLEKQQQRQAVMVNKLKMQNEIYQLLNEEQKAKFSAQFTKMTSKRSHR